ncbi:hypothetical protein [Mycobacterium neglectum]|uniref:hypothetical protein n=1 Tax=Mycobacterium neglectum TaxID=242737 RepID=UPI001FE7FDDA|nr:hypothetical protein [Mycobacterium neglectum]
MPTGDMLEPSWLDVMKNGVFVPPGQGPDDSRLFRHPPLFSGRIRHHTGPSALGQEIHVVVVLAPRPADLMNHLRIEAMMSVQVQQRTRMFARVLGPFFTIVAIVVALRAPDMRRLLSEFTASDLWPWVTGAFILMGGISIVAFHQLWRDPAAIIVSALGWLLIARGVFLLAFPDTFASVANRVIGAVGVWQAVYVVFAAIGLYLTYVGWKPVGKDRQDSNLHISIDFPSAA